ncbi:hypothetical protein DACRYDRAFT_99681 [Dacryopinax primogenitus]|uniref:N-acetyltransferase domain-containing protein n=1 Tax=Dacryopinax primogenitus (strain DJM 731) TaxID=1858805 RepID=M5FX71_DACPD|nr:uncharacterized protein DACRYDRAFT_99681 [Dacryopinax primogenitus]EJU02581.1 hypothetical protein DACRYDRAFT_99681 [Dacryopinax primogenitus]
MIPLDHRQPVLFDRSRADEPYIPLPSHHDNIRLTPWRVEDVDAVLPILNHPDVYPRLVGPAYPYTREHAQLWFEGQSKLFEPDRGYFTGDEAAPLRQGKFFDYTPMCVIREVQPDGSQIFLGVVDLVRSSFGGETDSATKEQLIKKNRGKTAGDPTIVYMVGDYLAASHHGKGIMTAAVRELIRSWGVPYMRIRLVHAAVMEGNVGSRRVFEKLGFSFSGFIEGSVPTQGKRDEVMGEWFFQYTAE